MASIKTIVVDDEPLALELLCSYLEDIPSVEILARCTNGRKALAAVAEYDPDLIFLDIQMPGITGFEVAKTLQSDEMPLIVFATAYEEFAVGAFEIHAVDYILKPLDKERIQLAVNRASERLDTQVAAESNKASVLGALDQMEQQKFGDGSDSPAPTPETTASPGKIVIKDRDCINLVNQEDISWVDAAGDYMCIHAAGETHVMRSTMKNLLEQLDDSLFKRVHRSTVVNMNHITQIFPHTKGEYFLLLGEHDRVKVSRNYREVVKEFLEKV